MKDQLITFETAKLAKDKGFNESTLWYYTISDNIKGVQGDLKIGTLRMQGAEVDSLIIKAYGHAFAPPQSLLQCWLREEKLVSVDLSCSFNRVGFTYVISVSTIKSKCEETKTFDSRYLIDPKTSSCIPWPLVFTDYYEALEYGLVEGLKEI